LYFSKSERLKDDWLNHPQKFVKASPYGLKNCKRGRRRKGRRRRRRKKAI